MSAATAVSSANCTADMSGPTCACDNHAMLCQPELYIGAVQRLHIRGQPTQAACATSRAAGKRKRPSHVVVITDTIEGLVKCFEPAGVVVAVADEVHIQLVIPPATQQRACCATVLPPSQLPRVKLHAECRKAHSCANSSKVLRQTAPLHICLIVAPPPILLASATAVRGNADRVCLGLSLKVLPRFPRDRQPLLLGRLAPPSQLLLALNVFPVATKTQERLTRPWDVDDTRALSCTLVAPGCWDTQLFRACCLAACQPPTCRRPHQQQSHPAVCPAPPHAVPLAQGRCQRC